MDAHGRRMKMASFLAALAGLTGAYYLWRGAQATGPGFPLDDAWIHQTYARNLARSGQWAFLPGQTSAGSTAPAWSAWLALGHALGLAPFAWTYLSGLLLLFAVAYLGAAWAARRGPEGLRTPFIIGAMLALEWHLDWVSFSGMETIALCAAILLLFLRLEGRPEGAFLTGALIGFGVWLRPDAVTLLGPALFVIFGRGLREGKWPFRSVGLLLFGAAMLISPYLAFNVRISGEIWPSTFYAKQAEYAVLRQAPFVDRLLAMLGLPLVGMSALLVPAWISAAWRALRRRDLILISAGLWAAGYAAIYAWRLPVTYQYGRYLMPLIPVLMVIGLSELLTVVRALERGAHWKRLVGRAWLLSSVATGFAFWLIGGSIFGRDVAIINTEMVATARWVSENTEQGALIAAHDIGALGYFGGRPIIDLAGLVSPEVIGFIRDESQIASYLDKEGTRYLMTFPGWYPSLVTGLARVYETRAPYSPRIGGENMVVYRWR